MGPLPGWTAAAGGRPQSPARMAHVTLVPGDRVELADLQGVPELNGIQGAVLGFDVDKGRWEVMLDEGHGKKCVLECNLLKRPGLLPAVRRKEAKAAPAAPATRVTGKRRQPDAEAPEAPETAEVPCAKQKYARKAGEAKATAAKAAKPAKAVHAKALVTAPIAAAAAADGGHSAAGVRRQAKRKLPQPGVAEAEEPTEVAEAVFAKRSACQSAAGVAAEASAPNTGRAAKEHASAREGALSPASGRCGRNTKASNEESSVAVLIRRLAAAEDEVPSLAQPSAAAVAAEVKACARMEAEELDGEGQRKRGRGAKRRDAEGDEEDKLFDFEEDDLEGEEVISQASDAGDVEDDDGDIACEAWRPIGALPWPDVWSCSHNPPRPGQEGFGVYASSCMARAKLGSAESPFGGLGLRLHQESAAFLAHPSSPLQRLLVDHATGTGKTLIILRILDNFFDDPRPKVAIFPKDSVCDNFYQELLKWPTRWRHYFSFCNPDKAALASGAKNWQRKMSEVWDLNNDRIRAEVRQRGVRLQKVIRELVDAMRETLEMKHAIRCGKVTPKLAKAFLKEHPGAPVPRAPLRAFRYTTAGGGACDLGEDGWPRSPILKVGFDPAELNPYSGKVVIMDECHNLVRPTAKFQGQLGRLRMHLLTARATILAGFTGTPVGNHVEEGRRLLDIIKGADAKTLSDEGFVSSFHARGSEDFPREVPVAGVPDGVLDESMLEGLAKRHSLHGEALKRYLLKEVEFQITPRLLQLPEEKRVSRLANYCNLHVHYGSYHSANRTALLTDVKDHAPKFHAIAKWVAKRNEKAVVMISREMGFRALIEVLRLTGKQAGFKVATLDELGDFNDARRNLRGERFRVLAVETSQAGEGVQFRHVRRLYIVDVPLRHSDLVQRASRCVRLGGHQELPLAERELAIELHIAQLPKFLRTGPGSLIYRELLNAKEVISTPGLALEAATEGCLKELRRRGAKTLMDLQRELQAEGGEQLIDLLTETALEQLGDTSVTPARPLAIALWRLRRGGDDLVQLEGALLRQVQTADELILDLLLDKSAELMPALEAMRLGAVDRALLAGLGDPPRAPARTSKWPVASENMVELATDPTALADTSTVDVAE